MGRTIDYGSRIFDDKVATSDAYRFDGTNGEAWREKTRNYIISKLPSIEVLLLWAESRGSAEVLPMHIEAACSAN